MGLGMSFLSMFLESCAQAENEARELVPQISTDFTGKVLIIGAGAAGMSAAYFLERNNIEYELLEASSIYGGRVKRAADFADFPIDLGAEWLHADPIVLSELLDDPKIDANIELITYNPQEISVWNGKNMRRHNWMRNFYSEHKFKSTTWYGFFEKYMIPKIGDKILYNHAVEEIDYQNDKVQLKTSNGQTFEADKVLVTVPIAMLQKKAITFTPALPMQKTEAIQAVDIGEGIKVFIEFEEKFYPDMIVMGGLIGALSASELIYYDAAFRKDAEKHVLALFTVGEKAAPYALLENDEAIINKILGELDEMYEGKASQTYKQHIIQNWSKEPFIGGSYALGYENRGQNIRDILEPLNDKVYFAGEAIHDEWQSTVNGACESGYEVVKNLLGVTD